MADPIVQITRTGAWLASSEALVQARARFEAEHYVLLSQFLEPSLAHLYQRLVQRVAFRVLDRWPAHELQIADVDVLGGLTFLLNDPAVLTAVERIAGCADVRCFVGSVYRLEPQKGHVLDWHTDVLDGRLVALTVNLSPAPYTGGVLEMRDAETETIFARISNPVPGDAILFEIGPSLEHRVSDIEGSSPKIALSGWFKPWPDYCTFVKSAGSRQ